MTDFHPNKHVSSVSSKFWRPEALRTLRATTTLLALLAVGAAMSFGIQPAMAADPPPESVLQAQAAADAAAAKAQKKINKLTARSRKAASKYAQVLAQAKSFEAYNKKLNQQLQAQQAQIASLQEQLESVKSTAREIQPLMGKMVDSLAKFVKLDLPFLRKERRQRIRKLKHTMDRVDVTIAEKYRQVLQDYMIELGYGHTIGAYKGTLGKGQDAPTVQFVRIGRVALMYQTLDGSETGYWNVKKNKWVVANRYADEFDAALKMAHQRGTPELLTVPVPVPQEAGE